jgi:hypothetical protein
LANDGIPFMRPSPSLSLNSGATPSKPGAITKFTVTASGKPIEERIRLNQVTKWAEHTPKEGPAGIAKRELVRQLLGKEI